MAGPRKVRVLCSLPEPLYGRLEKIAHAEGTSVPAIVLEWLKKWEEYANTPPIAAVQACPFTVEPASSALFEGAPDDESPFAFAPAPGRKT